MANSAYCPTYTVPDAGDREILTSGFAVKVAVTVALAVPIVNVVGLVVVEESEALVPDTAHELNTYPAAGLAVMLTVLPSTTFVTFGDLVNVPELAGVAVTVNVCEGIVK